MKLEVNWAERNARLRYTVHGTSLERVQAVLLARGHIGKFEWKLPYKMKWDAEQTIAVVTLAPSSSIQMPVWKQYRLQPQACQDEWDSMWKALDAHEKGHSKLFEAALARLTANLEAQRSMKVNDLRSHMKQQSLAMKKEQKRYDVETDNGRSRGVQLNIAEACRSQE